MGSGKSTLLQTLCGTLTPSYGNIEVFGRVAALLELGAGFNPEFTGLENVYMNAGILGLSRETIDRRFTDIVSFSWKSILRSTGQNLFEWDVCSFGIRSRCSLRPRYSGS